ncbi:hypothetical protein BDQ17DRAFT_1357226 [Cyathus striatus]|nr:hypothetical protein BDQ17DRAFT_1357226 [Cyathus striatus]
MELDSSYVLTHLSRLPPLTMTHSHLRAPMPIPPELILEIIDVLAQEGDSDTLSSFSLVHRTLLHPCRTRLFRTITLGPRPDKGKSGTGLLTLLRSSPFLISYIHHLHITDYAGPNQIHWLLTDICLTKILPLLSLSRLKLEFTGRTVVWSLLPPGLKCAIVTTVRSPRMSELEMTGVHGISGHLICGNAGLKRLALRAMWIPPSSSSATPVRLNGEKRRRFSLFSGTSQHISEKGKIRLESLLLGGDGAGSWVLESGIDLSGLKVLEIHPRFPSEVERAKEIIARARESICEFSWKGSVNLDGAVSPLPIILSTLPALQTVNFHTTMYWDDMTYEPPQFYLEECIRFLRSATRTGKGNQIRNVSLAFDCTWWSALPEVILRFLCNDPLWGILAELLSDRISFPMLRNVSVEARVRSGEGKRVIMGVKKMERQRKGRYQVLDVPHCMRRMLAKVEDERREVVLDVFMVLNECSSVY